MSECSITMRTQGREIPASCARCNGVDCEVWRGSPAPHGEKEKLPSPLPPAVDENEPRPDPAYAAALSETSILVDARARAFGLALERLRPLNGEPWPTGPEVVRVSNEILKYILEGK